VTGDDRAPDREAFVARCPLVDDGGPRTARPLAEWTLIDGDERTAVELPHTWNAADAVGGDPGYDRGRKRYRRTVAPVPEGDHRHLLHFGGANQRATVRVDGEVVGRHAGGYTAFTVDVTDAVSSTDPSRVSVTVDNTHDPEVPPLGADFTFFGGLYRPAWLVTTDAVALDGSETGSTGVLVDAVESTSVTDAWTVRVRADVANTRPTAAAVTVTHEVVSPEGRPVASCETTGEVGAGGTERMAGTTTVDAPDLWRPESPTVYAVETTVSVDGTTVDRLRSPLGFREVAVDDTGRVRLNGDPITLRGTNRHQDRPDLGTALSAADHRDDVSLVAGTGANFLRLAHYPQSPAVLDATDRAGLLVWEEIPVVNRVTDSAAFTRTCRRMAREMVHQHYNHPSVAMWGFMNEILLETDLEDDDQVDATVELARELEALLAAEDPTRPTAMACHFSDAYDDVGLTDVPDVLGWNVYLGWYHDEVDDIGDALDEKVAARPGQATVVSEYGVGSDVRLHSRTPEAWDFTEEFSSHYHERYIAAFDERGDRVATAQWNAFDFASAQRDDTVPDINQKGLLTYDRTTKAAYHLYRAWLADDPVVHVATRHWARRAGGLGGHGGDDADAVGHPVTVYSNAERVELAVDGTTHGVQSPDDGYATHWRVPLPPGEHGLEARATTADGDRVVDEAAVSVVAFDDPGGDDWTVPEQGLAVNVGSDRDVLASERLWVAGSTYASARHARGPIGGERESTLDRVTGTDCVPLYQHCLAGLDGYRVSVPAGRYHVQLRFCELTHEDPGERVFDVNVGDETVATAFDPCGEIGPRRVASVETVTEVTEGPIVVEFDAQTGRPLLNAVLVRSAD
jgi:beta-galactosidase